MSRIKLLKIGLVAAAVIVIGAQLYRPDRTNPPIIASETLEAATEVPADIRAMITRSCSDCHSNNTVYPWYSNVSPASWFLANHIEDGRRHLNFSVWNTYSTEKKAKKLDEICEHVRSGEMPLPSYLWLHGDAALTESDAAALCEWSKSESYRILGSN